MNFSHYSALTYSSTAKPGYSLIMDDHPDLDLPVMSFEKKGTDKGKITNLAAWFRTWNAYMSVATQFRPHTILDLLAYQDTITEYANTHPAQYWLAYDRAFRQYMANNPTASWASENRRIYNTFLRNAPLLPSVSLPVSSASGSSVASASGQSPPQSQSFRPGPCFKCHKFGHKIADCPQNVAATHTGAGGQVIQSSTQSSRGGNNHAQTPFCDPQLRTSDASGVCIDWNRGQPCPPGCRRDHRCSFCSRLHPRRDCQDPRLQDNNRYTQQ